MLSRQQALPAQVVLQGPALLGQTCPAHLVRAQSAKGHITYARRHCTLCTAGLSPVPCIIVDLGRLPAIAAAAADTHTKQAAGHATGIAGCIDQQPVSEATSRAGSCMAPAGEQKTLCTGSSPLWASAACNREAYEAGRRDAAAVEAAGPHVADAEHQTAAQVHLPAHAQLQSGLWCLQRCCGALVCSPSHDSWACPASTQACCSTTLRLGYCKLPVWSAQEPCHVSIPAVLSIGPAQGASTPDRMQDQQQTCDACSDARMVGPLLPHLCRQLMGHAGQCNGWQPAGHPHAAQPSAVWCLRRCGWSPPDKDPCGRWCGHAPLDNWHCRPGNLKAA